MSFAISALATGAAAFHMPLSAAPHSAGLAAVRMQELASLGAPPMQQTGAQGQVVRTKGPARRLSSPPARRGRDPRAGRLPAHVVVPLARH